MTVRACDASTQETEAGDQESQASVGYLVEGWWSAYGLNLCLAAP